MKGRRPKPDAKRKSLMIRARVTPGLRARCERVWDLRELDESVWVREALIAHLEAEERRLGLPPMRPEEIEAQLNPAWRSPGMTPPTSTMLNEEPGQYTANPPPASRTSEQPPSSYT